MSAKMNHYVACRAEAAVCREKAEADSDRRDYWHAEAQKWERRAEDSEPGGGKTPTNLDK
jgi:hypothetical protein